MLKQFATALLLEAGAHTLFQDADLIWEKDPIAALMEGAKAHKTQWMDDGSRDTRFAPFFANTGFYFLYNHFSVRQFWDHVVMTSGYVIEWRSNQEVVNWMLEDHNRRFSLEVKTLPQKIYVSGNNLDQFEQFNKNKQVLVRHFCWTANKAEKLKRLKQFDVLLITEDCFNDIDKCYAGGSSLDKICTR
jgi:hypothetical protein